MFVQLLLICMSQQAADCNHMIHTDFFATKELCEAAELTDGEALKKELTAATGKEPVIFDFRCVEMTLKGVTA